MPALVFGLCGPLNCSGSRLMDMAIVLHDGLLDLPDIDLPCPSCMILPDPWESTRTIVVGVAAFSGSFHGFELVPAKRRYLVPPTSG